MLRKLFQPVDIAALVFFRIAFGLLGFADVLNTYIYYHLMERSFDPDRFQFYYFGFSWVRPLPEPWMTAFFALLLLSALAIAIGWRYRWAAGFFFLGFSYLYLLEKAHYLNHGYLFCWISFVMIWLPADRHFSLRVLRDPAAAREAIPAWSAFLLPFLMGVVYFFGGIAKLNGDWLRGVPLNYWVQARADLPLIGPFMEQAWMPYFLSYGGLFLDLFIVFFLLNRKTRPWAYGAVVFFHAMNLLIFNIGIFPWLSLALTAMFFPPDFPRRLVAWLEERAAWVHRLADGWRRRWAQARTKAPAREAVPPIWQAATPYRGAILLALGILLVIHIALPLRHHLFPGDVAWTEEGHRYAWRMMLRAKAGYGKYTVVNRRTRDSVLVQPRDHLRTKQVRKLFGHPDMILAYAHHLRDSFQMEWGDPVSVYADIKVRLNDGPYGFMVDPGADLAEIEWSFFTPSPWIGDQPQ